jgi:putative transposase
VWVTKCRYNVLRGDVGQQVRELVRQTPVALKILILKRMVRADNARILVSESPDGAPSAPGES